MGWVRGSATTDSNESLESVFAISRLAKYADIEGVRITALAEGSDLELPLFDPSQGFPAFGIPPLPFPSCADADTAGEFCFATPGLGFSPTPDAVKKSDLDALHGRTITITPMTADMTGKKIDLEGTLGNLAP